MERDFGEADEACLSSAACVGAVASEAATAEEGLRLLRAFRAIACLKTRLRILALVDAEASREGDATTA